MIWSVFLVDLYCFWKMYATLECRQPLLPWLPQMFQVHNCQRWQANVQPLSALKGGQGLIMPSFYDFLRQQDLLSDTINVVIIHLQTRKEINPIFGGPKWCPNYTTIILSPFLLETLLVLREMGGGRVDSLLLFHTSLWFCVLCKNHHPQKFHLWTAKSVLN